MVGGYRGLKGVDGGTANGWVDRRKLYVQNGEAGAISASLQLSVDSFYKGSLEVALGFAHSKEELPVSPRDKP